MIIAETPRLLIRQMTEPDLRALAFIWTDAQVTRFMGGPRVFDAVCAALREGFGTPPAKFDLWPVVEKSSLTVVGHCGLLPKTVNDREEIELTYVIASAFWGRGYATEAATALRDYAFHTLNVPRLVALIDPANAVSEHIAQKLGLTFESNTLRPGGKILKVYAAPNPS